MPIQTELVAEPAPLPGRWTICAMLFVATTINYMDRQVLSILKPVLAGSHAPPAAVFPRLADSRIVDQHDRDPIRQYCRCFQIAYALGVIFAGRSLTGMGCREGYPIVTGLWSLAAMGHALVQFGLRLRSGAIFSRPGRERQFSRGDQSRRPSGFLPRNAPWPRASSTLARASGAILAPSVVPWVALHFGWRAAFLDHRRLQRDLDRLVVVIRVSHAASISRSLRVRNVARPASPAQPACNGGSCFAIARHGDSCSASFSPIRSGGSISSGCRHYFNSRFKLDLSHIGLPLVVVYVYPRWAAFAADGCRAAMCVWAWT